MSFLDKNGLQVLTTKLVQGDAIKVASHRGHTVKNVIDNIQRECENISTPNIMNLENRINEFKVGKGRDVDVSGDVEEGKIEVELQGKTWQNLVKNYWTMGNVEVDDKYITASPSYGQYIGMSGGFVYNLKQGVQYTFIVNVIENTLEDSFEFALIQDGSWKNGLTIKSRQTGTIVRKITANADAISGYKIQTSNKNHSGTLKFEKNFLLLEGDYTQTPVEELPKYFEGIKSSFEDGIVDVEVQGKNLVDLSKFNRVSNAVSQVNIVNNTISFSSSARYNGVGQTFSEEEYKKMVGKYVTVSCGKITTSTGDSNDAYVFLKQSFVNSDGSTTWNNSTIASGQSKKIKILEGVDLTRFGIFVEPSNPVSGSIDIKAENIQLEIDSTSASYEPYYKKKISFNIGEPLRSLPNGVCDEITRDCKLIRRVGKVVLDGSEDEQYSTESFGNGILLFKLNQSRDYSKNRLICNTFPVFSTSQYGRDFEACYWVQGLKFMVKESKLSTQNIIGFKQWLSQNPTTVYYELAEPIITPIEPIEFDVKPLATMTINSEIAPISNHKVVLNRAGQIEQGIVQIAELKKRVDSLETAYDSYLLETQHKLSILGFEYELESEEN